MWLCQAYECSRLAPPQCYRFRLRKQIGLFLSNHASSHRSIFLLADLSFPWRLVRCWLTGSADFSTNLHTNSLTVALKEVATYEINVSRFVQPGPSLDTFGTFKALLKSLAKNNPPVSLPVHHSAWFCQQHREFYCEKKRHDALPARSFTTDIYSFIPLLGLSSKQPPIAL